MVDWAAAEGSNPGLHDADVFFATDPDEFFGLDVDGELGVTLSVARYDDTFAFMGFYICRPELRGHGLGVELFEAGLRGEVTTLGLDGVLEQEPNYTSATASSPRITASVTAGPSTSPRQPTPGYARSARLTSTRPVALERAARVFAAPRRAFLERWITAPGATACRDGRRRPRRWLRRGACLPRRPQDRPALLRRPHAAAERLLAALLPRTSTTDWCTSTCPS